MTAVTFFDADARRAESVWRPFFAIARPFLLLAVVAFFAGFGGYLILGPPQVMSAVRGAEPAAAAAPAAATPASDDAAPQWDAPKRV